MARTCALIVPVQPILHQVSCSNKTLPNAPKHFKTHKNRSLESDWVDQVRSLRKIPMRLHATNLCINPPCQPTLHRVSRSNEIIQNVPKHYEMHQNMSLGSNGVDRLGSLQKIPMRFRGTNFCINFSSSARFAPSFMEQWNNPKCTQTPQNAPIQEFRVQWGGSGVFILKNSKATSWHKLVH